MRGEHPSHTVNSPVQGLVQIPFSLNTTLSASVGRIQSKLLENGARGRGGSENNALFLEERGTSCILWGLRCINSWGFLAQLSSRLCYIGQSKIAH